MLAHSKPVGWNDCLFELLWGSSAGFEAHGMYGPPPNCKRKMRGTGLVCANVYGLCWREALLARMECATLSSHLVRQSWKTSSESGFESAGFDRRAISLFASKPCREIVNSSVALEVKQRPVGEPDRVLRSPAPPRPSGPTYWLTPRRQRCDGYAM